MLLDSGTSLHDTLISFFQIILSLLLPPAILLLEFKSKAEMCHVPQSHEAMLFGLDSVKSVPAYEGTDHTVKCESRTFPAHFQTGTRIPMALVSFFSYLVVHSLLPSLLSSHRAVRMQSEASLPVTNVKCQKLYQL